MVATCKDIKSVISYRACSCFVRFSLVFQIVIQVNEIMLFTAVELCMR